MTAAEAIKWIESARYSAVKVGLENMRALLAELGNPQRDLKCVHVAGTNGKGSVCAIIESVLREAGYRTGLYTSPYLMAYNERIRLNGTPVDDTTLAECASRVYLASRSLNERGVKPSAFELGTAVAFLAFKEAQVDVAVVETGLGGRLDPTNVILPEVCAIASIGMDHMDVLGDTLELIAGEKAGIIKPNTPVAVYPAKKSVMEVFYGAALRNGAPLIESGDYGFIGLTRDKCGCGFSIDIPSFGLTNVRLGLPGAHQAENARLAIVTLGELSKKGFVISREHVSRGVSKTVWPGRLEWVGDDTLLDGAHNVDGAVVLSDYLKSYLNGREIVLLTGMMADKRPGAYAKVIAPYVSRVVTTRVDWHRAVASEELAEIYRELGKEALSVDGIEKALGIARGQMGENGVLLVAGSLYLVGAVRKLFYGST